MTRFSATPCLPQGEPTANAASPYILISQTSGETYMGPRHFVIHRDEVDALVAALKAAR